MIFDLVIFREFLMRHVRNDYVCYIQRKIYASPQVDHTKIWHFNNTFVP